MRHSADCHALVGAACTCPRGERRVCATCGYVVPHGRCCECGATSSVSMREAEEIERVRREREARTLGREMGEAT